MRNIIILISFLGLTSCGQQMVSKRSQTWSQFFGSDDQKALLLAQADKLFDKGKNELSIKDLMKAQEAYRFLAIEYVYDPADKKVKEVDAFIQQRYEYYKDLFRQTSEKNLMFTAAGYCKQILLLSPSDQEAKNYLEINKEEIEVRLNRNIEAGFTYLNQNKLNSAKRCFNRVLVYDPDNLKSITAIRDIDRKKQSVRLAQKKKETQMNKTIAKSEESKTPNESLSKEEQEKLYKLGVLAYEKKDYIKAYDIFEDLIQTTYKDSVLYYKRTEDKINVLGLTEE